MKQLKLTPDVLLKLLLKKNNMTYKQWHAQATKQLQLNQATLLTTEKYPTTKLNAKTQEPLYVERKLYDSGDYMLSATTHGTIKDIQPKPSAPKVIIKKRRIIPKGPQ